MDRCHGFHHEGFKQLRSWTYPRGVDIIDYVNLSLVPPDNLQRKGFNVNFSIFQSIQATVFNLWHYSEVWLSHRSVVWTQIQIALPVRNAVRIPVSGRELATQHFHSLDVWLQPHSFSLHMAIKFTSQFLKHSSSICLWFKGSKEHPCNIGPIRNGKMNEWDPTTSTTTTTTTTSVCQKLYIYVIFRMTKTTQVGFIWVWFPSHFKAIFPSVR